MSAIPVATVLLVEDDSVDFELTALMLKHHGFPHALVMVGDGIEALEYLTGTGAHAGRDPLQRPALVLMDVNMPRMSGFETLKKIRANPALADLPVAFLTSSRSPKDNERAAGLGAKAYLGKPWPDEEAQFVRRLEAILSELLP